MAAESILGVPEMRPSLLDNVHDAARRHPTCGRRSACRRRSQGGCRTSGCSNSRACRRGTEAASRRMTPHLLSPEEDDEVFEDEEFDEDSEEDEDAEDEDDEEEETWQVRRTANGLTS